MNDLNFIAIFYPGDTTQAGLIRESLEQAGIECYVNNEEASGIRFGGMGIGAAEMTVMVPAEQAHEATTIISELGFD